MAAKKTTKKQSVAKKQSTATAPAKKSRLTRARNPMPAYVRQALVSRGLMQKYKDRPDYQQNDYLGWIARGKLEATRQKRLAQMLEELELGDVYMKMRWAPLSRAPWVHGAPRVRASVAATRTGKKRTSATRSPPRRAGSRTARER